MEAYCIHFKSLREFLSFWDNQVINSEKQRKNKFDEKLSCNSAIINSLNQKNRVDFLFKWMQYAFIIKNVILKHTFFGNLFM